MKIILTGEESLTIEPSSGPLTIEAESRDHSYSPFHMLGSALGACTFSVMQSWGSNKSIGVDDIRIDVSWKFVEGGHRLAAMNVKLQWPSLPAELWPRVIRAAHICGVHQTLSRGIQINVDAPDTQSPEIEATALLEATRAVRRTPAPVAQADGQPRPPSVA